MNYIYLLLIFELILLIWSFLLNGQDIMAPSAIMCAMFVLSTVFAIMNIEAWGIDYSLEAVLLLSTGLLVFILAETFFRIVFVKKKKEIKQGDTQFYEIPVQMWMIVFLIVFNLAVSFWYYIEIKNIVGNGQGNVFELFASYRRMNVSNLANSKSESISTLLNQFLKVVKASGYISVYMALNKFFCKGKKGQTLGLLIVAATSLIPSIMIASRAEFLKFFSAILIEYYILWHQKHGWDRVFSWKYIKIGLIILLVGIPVFYNSLHLMGRGSTEMTMMEYASEYVGSSIQLFDLYIKEPVPCNSFGEETLVGIRKVLGILGIQSASKSSNLEFRLLGEDKSNVYTFFRRPLHDYGLVGMYIFTILVAFLFAWLYYCKIKNRAGGKKTDCWVLIYGYLYYWMVSSSILQYSQSYISVGAALIIAAIIIGYLIMTCAKLKIKVTRKITGRKIRLRYSGSAFGGGEKNNGGF